MKTPNTQEIEVGYVPLAENFIELSAVSRDNALRETFDSLGLMCEIALFNLQSLADQFKAFQEAAVKSDGQAIAERRIIVP